MVSSFNGGSWGHDVDGAVRLICDDFFETMARAIDDIDFEFDSSSFACCT